MPGRVTGIANLTESVAQFILVESTAHLTHSMIGTTFHTYAQCHADGGILARTSWERCSPAQAVAATLRHESDAIVLRASTEFDSLIGFAPLGMGAK